MSSVPDATPVPAALLEWAGRPGAERVLAEARRRAERGSLGTQGRLRVALSPAERSDVGILLGVDWEVGPAAPPLALLRGALRQYAVTLDDLLVATGGPVRDRAGERRSAADGRADEVRRARERLIAAMGAPAADLVAAQCLPAPGRGGRLARADDLAYLTEVLDGLDEPVGLAVLAARCFGDAHALDRTRALGRAAARMLALRAGGGVDDVLLAEGWRSAWAWARVACDRVSSTVLVLNLPLTGSPAIGATTTTSGEPVWLTTRLLDSPGLAAPAVEGREVFVCENPSVVEAAADRLGAGCAPLVCTYGNPSVAAFRLLRVLEASGARLRVRADDDEAGRAIVAAIRAACPSSTPWRYGNGPTYEEEVVEDLIADLHG